VRKSRAYARREVMDALDTCVIARLGPRLLHTGGRTGAPLPALDVSPRDVTIEVANRVLRGISDGAPRVGLLFGARRVPWTPETHPYCVAGETRLVVRHLLMHFCRMLGLYSGAVVAKRVFSLVFAPPAEERSRGPPLGPQGTGARGAPADEQQSFSDKSIAERVEVPLLFAAAKRVRFGFLLPHAVTGWASVPRGSPPTSSRSDASVPSQNTSS
jgi:hypothetical protein